MKTPLSVLILVSFIVTAIVGPLPVYAQEDFRLPAPGVQVHLSPEFNPPVLKGIKVHPENPFRFEFILDKGDDYSVGEASKQFLKDQSTKLIKYFLASLTIPEKDLWVNLSPYEKDRIVPQSFGLTEMGRDLLAEDYMLKQITASLIYPEGETGKRFWKRIYEEAQKKFGTTNIPVNTFNKVWIVPQKAVIYENAQAGTAYVVESRLKVMLEEDYLSLQKHSDTSQVRNFTKAKELGLLGANIVREIVIPELSREVNEDKNFAQLRQVYNSLILATWYKKKIKDSILEQVYADKNKIAGVGYKNSSPVDVETIYQRYLQAFKKGVYNYIKEDFDPVTQETVPRKYFSGGMAFDKAMDVVLEYTNQAPLSLDNAMKVTVDMASAALPAVQEFRSLHFSDPETERFVHLYPGFFSIFDLDRQVSNFVGFYEPRIRFRALGKQQQKVVIDDRYRSIVVNSDRFEGSIEDHDLIVMAFLQTEDMRGTNFYGNIDNKVSRIKRLLNNSNPLPAWRNKLRVKQRYQIVSQSQRDYHGENFTAGKPITAYQEIPVVNVPGLAAPQESQEIKIKAFERFARSGWNNISVSAAGLAEMTLETFEDEIGARFNELKRQYMGNSQASVWEMLLLDKYSQAPFLIAAEKDSFFREIFGEEYSRMFRYGDFYRWVSENHLKQEVVNALDHWKPGSPTLNLNIAIVGASYGQEPITMAILTDRMIQRELGQRPQIPQNAIKLQVHVLSVPNKIFDKLKINKIVYPAADIEKYVKSGDALKMAQTRGDGYFTTEEFNRFFEVLPSGGLIRKPYLNDRLVFHAVRLGDVATYTHDIPACDVLTLNNVLQYVRPADNEAAQQEFPEVMNKTYAWLMSIVKKGGVISYANEGDGHHPETINLFKRIFESKDFQPVTEGFRSTIVVRKTVETMGNKAQLAEGVREIRSVSQPEALTIPYNARPMGSGAEGEVYPYPSHPEKVIKIFANNFIVESQGERHIEDFKKLYQALIRDPFLKDRIIEMDFVNVDFKGRKTWGIVMPHQEGVDLERTMLWQKDFQMGMGRTNSDLEREASTVLNKIDEISKDMFGVPLADRRSGLTNGEESYENFIFLQKQKRIINIDPINYTGLIYALTQKRFNDTTKLLSELSPDIGRFYDSLSQQDKVAVDNQLLEEGIAPTPSILFYRTVLENLRQQSLQEQRAEEIYSKSLKKGESESRAQAEKRSALPKRLEIYLEHPILTQAGVSKLLAHMGSRKLLRESVYIGFNYTFNNHVQLIKVDLDQQDLTALSWRKINTQAIIEALTRKLERLESANRAMRTVADIRLAISAFNRQGGIHGLVSKQTYKMSFAKDPQQWLADYDIYQVVVESVNGEAGFVKFAIPRQGADVLRVEFLEAYFPRNEGDGLYPQIFKIIVSALPGEVVIGIRKIQNWPTLVQLARKIVEQLERPGLEEIKQGYLAPNNILGMKIIIHQYDLARALQDYSKVGPVRDVTNFIVAYVQAQQERQSENEQRQEQDLTLLTPLEPLGTFYGETVFGRALENAGFHYHQVLYSQDKEIGLHTLSRRMNPEEPLHEQVSQAMSSPPKLPLNMNLNGTDIAHRLDNFGQHPVEETMTIAGQKFDLQTYIYRSGQGMYSLGPLVFFVARNLQDYFFRKKVQSAEVLASLKEDYKGKLEAYGSVFKKNSSNILYVPSVSAVEGEPLNLYTSLMIAAMLYRSKDFKDSVVYDFGAGAGTLSLVALKMGAKKAILIENDERQAAIADGMLEFYGYKKGVDYEIIAQDLRNETEVLQRLKDAGIEGLKKISMVNIGAWYGNINKIAAKLSLMLGVDLLFNGGFPRGTEVLQDSELELFNMQSRFEGQGYRVKRIDEFASSAHDGVSLLMAERAMSSVAHYSSKNVYLEKYRASSVMKALEEASGKGAVSFENFSDQQWADLRKLILSQLKNNFEKEPVSPDLEAAINEYFTKEQLLQYKKDFNHLDMGDLLLIFMRLHTLCANLSGYGLKAEAFHAMSLKTIMVLVPLSDSFVLHILEEADMGGIKWALTKDTPSFTRMLERGSFDDVRTLFAMPEDDDIARSELKTILNFFKIDPVRNFDKEFVRMLASMDPKGQPERNLSNEQIGILAKEFKSFIENHISSILGAEAAIKELDKLKQANPKIYKFPKANLELASVLTADRPAAIVDANNDDGIQKELIQRIQQKGDVALLMKTVFDHAFYIVGRWENVQNIKVLYMRYNEGRILKGITFHRSQGRYLGYPTEEVDALFPQIQKIVEDREARQEEGKGLLERGYRYIGDLIFSNSGRLKSEYSVWSNGTQWVGVKRDTGTESGPSQGAAREGNPKMVVGPENLPWTMANVRVVDSLADLAMNTGEPAMMADLAKKIQSFTFEADPKRNITDIEHTLDKLAVSLQIESALIDEEREQRALKDGRFNNRDILVSKPGQTEKDGLPKLVRDSLRQRLTGPGFIWANPQNTIEEHYYLVKKLNEEFGYLQNVINGPESPDKKGKLIHELAALQEVILTIKPFAVERAMKTEVVQDPRGWDLNKVLIKKMDRDFFDWVNRGGMAPQDRKLLEDILSGDKNILTHMLVNNSDKVRIKNEDDLDGNNGRTVYLRLTKPFISSAGELEVLRIKGGRVEPSENTEVLSHKGRAQDKFVMEVNGQGDLTAGTDTLAPQGGVGNFDLEFEQMRAGQEGLGFQTDYPIAAGIWKGRNHQGNEVGCVISGMRSDDVRIFMPLYPNNFLKDVVTGVNRTISFEFAEKIFEKVGQSLRAYHDAGYFHRYTHVMNIGVEIGPEQQIRIILRDLDTTKRRSELSGDIARQEAAYRLIDIQRLIARMSGDGKEFKYPDRIKGYLEPYIEAFWRGYLGQDAKFKYQVPPMSFVSSMKYFSFLPPKVKDEKILPLKEDVLLFGTVWKLLYDLQKNSARPAQGEQAMVSIEDYRIAVQKVQETPNFRRLSDILGFTGMGADVERRYIKDLSVDKHDIRTSQVASNVATRLGLNAPKAEFMGLVHDYGAFPFRHITMQSQLKQILGQSGFNSKRHLVELLQQDGFNLPDDLIRDLLNFDIAKTDQMSSEGAIAVASESVEGVVEDILFALKYKMISFSEIPQTLKEVLSLDSRTEDQLLRDMDSDFDGTIIQLTERILMRGEINLKSVVERARLIKQQARDQLIVERVFNNKIIDTKAEIAKVNSLIMAAFNTNLRNSGISGNEGVLNALDALSRLRETDLLGMAGENKPYNRAMNAKNIGGIDLTPANMHLQTQDSGEGIKFHLDPAMLAQLRNAPGFVPVIINIEPLGDLRMFLGLNKSGATQS